MGAVSRRGLSPNERLFVASFDGDAEVTAKRCTIGLDPAAAQLFVEEAKSWARQAWFADALRKRAEDDARWLIREQRERMAKAIATREDLQEMWSAIARGECPVKRDPSTGEVILDQHGEPERHPIPSMRDRLAASKMLADSLGMNLLTVTHEGGEKPIKVSHETLQDRIGALLGERPRIAAHQPAADWLQ